MEYVWAFCSFDMKRCLTGVILYLLLVILLPSSLARSEFLVGKAGGHEPAS